MTPSRTAELSSLLSALEELGRRVTGIAEAAAADERDSLAAGLFEVERALQEAQRRLAKLLDDLGGPAQ